MKYMGSKNRHAKELVPILTEYRKSGQTYVEPFVGGFNMIDKLENPRIANDTHPYLIELFQALQKGWVPPDEVTEDEYKDIRENMGSYPPALVGFVGFGCSYSGKWFGGYARGNDSKGNPRNYAAESKRNILKQLEKIRNVKIQNDHYLELEVPENSIIYCDPPYKGTTQYKDTFDHEVFWNWVREKVAEGHTVYVSEYSAPKDFICIWMKRVNSSLEKDTGSKQGIEKLFIHKSQVDEWLL